MTLLQAWRIFNVCFLGSFALVESTVRVMMISNTAQMGAGWQSGFADFFVPYLNTHHGGMNITGEAGPTKMEVVLCLQDLSTDTKAKVEACVTAASQGKDLAGNAVGAIDAIVVGTSSGNTDVQAAAEKVKIPNLHCSGGNPAIWTSATPHAFGLHLPFPWYSRGPIRQAKLLGIKSIVVIRDWDWGFPRISAVAAMEWSLESNLKVIGPTLQWCKKWASFTKTCREVKGACRCGAQSEWDSLAYKYKAETMPSFYELSESKVAESGFNVRSEFISPAMVDYVKGIIQDVRSQGGDPDMVVNWMAAARSGLMAMFQEKFSYKMYFGGPNVKGKKWNGYESYFKNGTEAMAKQHAMYNVGGGQWHHEMQMSDPIFGSSGNAVKLYREKFGSEPSYDAAACMTAGIAISYGLQKYGKPLSSLSIADRRQEVRTAVGNFNDETLYGQVRFNRFNQNSGQMTVNWQVLENGGTRPVLPAENAATRFRFPSPTWDARLGCPPGTFAKNPSDLTVPTECVPCGEGTHKKNSSAILTSSVCEVCPKGFGTLPGVTSASACDACPAGRMQNGGTDRGVCNECPPGTARASGEAACTLCAVNTFSKTGAGTCTPCQLGFVSGVGSASCDACDAGQYRGAGNESCLLCDRGTYQNKKGQTSCVPCDSVLRHSSSQRGSKEPTECMCPPGSVRLAGNVCVTCDAKILHCPGERQEMMIKTMKGYMAVMTSPETDGGSPDLSAPVAPTYRNVPFVYKCINVVDCPGDKLPESCPVGHTGVACASCKKDYARNGGVCVSCDNEGDMARRWIGLFLVIGVALCGCGGVLHVLSKPKLAHMSITASLATVLSIFVNFLQMNTILTEVALKWPPLFANLMAYLGFLAFNGEFLELTCMFGPIDVFTAMFSKITLWICVEITIVALWCLSQTSLVAGLYKKLLLPALTNSMGFATNIVFVPMAISAFSLLNCYLHPTSNSSMKEFPSVVCFGDTWKSSALPAGVLVIIAVTAIYSLFLTLTWKGPTLEVPARINFLLARFRPEAYYWGAILLSRNFLLSLLPCVSRNPFIVAGLMILVCVVYSFLLSRRWPWKTSVLNIADSIGMGALVMTIHVGTCFSEEPTYPTATDHNTAAWKFLELCSIGPLFMAILGILFVFVQNFSDAKKDRHTFIRGVIFKEIADVSQDCLALNQAMVTDEDASAQLKENVMNLSVYDLTLLCRGVHIIRTLVLGDSDHAATESLLGRRTIRATVLPVQNLAKVCRDSRKSDQGMDEAGVSHVYTIHSQPDSLPSLLHSQPDSASTVPKSGPEVVEFAI
eukprot:TRINITY_DN7805_c0_g1_i2.p1 TRINITY_DN7805_c0_g1~~TRINITY_DN7805_c0_g1_i2.p1  ORF type:complete len:1299 (+),score=204.13 TRINITY_DN7805_c0_g1_i2:53-3949(+)